MSNVSKLKVRSGFKRVIAAGLTLVVVSTSGYMTYKKVTNTSTLDGNNNTEGYTDINPVFNTNVKENNFVVLNVGNHKNQGVLYLDSKLKYCEKCNISVGLIIDSEAKNKNEIYNDAEYAKKLINENKIDFPVYLCIDNIISDNDLNVLEKTELIQNFADKVTSNGIYVGLYGTDTNLYNLNKYCFDIGSYDIFLKEEGPRKYEEKCSLVETVDGKIISNSNLANTISEKKLNSSDNFVQDLYYIVDDGDILEAVAMEFGLSVNDLLNYNNISAADFHVGIGLRIPTDSQQIKKKFINSISQNAVTIGVDLSHYQNKIDWNVLSSNADFAILKLLDGTKVDTTFESNLINCLNNGMSVGVYSVTKAQTVEEIKEEAMKTVEQLKNKKVTYPVYLDYETNPSNELEYSRWQYIKNSGQFSEMLKAWSEIIEAAGYIPGVYCNQSTYFEMSSIDTENVLNKFQKWIAGSKYYCDSIDIDDTIDPGCSVNYQDLSVDCNMRQVSECCKNSGAENSNGNVDLNFCYTDYNKYDTYYEHEFNIKEFNKNNIKDWLANLGIAAGGILVLYTGTKIIIKKKKKKKLEQRRRKKVQKR